MMLRFVPLILFFLLIGFLWKGLSQDPHTIPSPLIGKALPDFAEPSLADKNVILSKQQFLGHITLLNVWASWCITCRAEHLELMTIANSKQVILFGLNYKDQRDNALKWLTRAGNPYLANIYDPDGKLALNLGVYGTPETFLVDGNGIIRYKYIGALTPDVWKDELLPQIKHLEADANSG